MYRQHHGDDDEVEDYGMQYSEESTSEPDVDLENQYYQSKLIKEESPAAALGAFRHVIDLQGDNRSEWGFKALKQMIKINFALGLYEAMMACYKEMLLYVRSSVTKNQGEKAINSILEYTSTSSHKELLQEFYETTLDALKDAKNERLWFKTNCKLGKVYFDRLEYAKLRGIINQLKQSCVIEEGLPEEEEEGEDEHGNQLLEIYALEIQFYTEMKNNQALRQLYERALRIRAAALPHPMVMSVIRECGGKMHLRAAEYSAAYTDFFEAFKNYDEAGSTRRLACLRYLMLTSMLMRSTISPIDSQEVAPYRDDPDIRSMRDLLLAFQKNDASRFEAIFAEHRAVFLEDPFMREHIDGLFYIMRSEALRALVKPYRAVRLTFTARALNISEEENVHLIARCILNDRIRGRIDERRKMLVLHGVDEDAGREAARLGAAEKYMDAIERVHCTLAEYVLYDPL